jgi:hypothetical protein
MLRPVYCKNLNRRGAVAVEAGRGDSMKTAHEPPLRAGQDDVLHALVSIIATTRRHWGLPDERPEAVIGGRVGQASISSRPYPRTARISRRSRPPG